MERSGDRKETEGKIKEWDGKGEKEGNGIWEREVCIIGFGGIDALD